MNHYRRPHPPQRRGMEMSGIILMIAGLFIIASAFGISPSETIDNIKKNIDSQLRDFDSDNVYNDWAEITGNVDEEGKPIHPDDIDIELYDMYGSFTHSVIGKLVTKIHFEAHEGRNPVASIAPMPMNIGFGSIDTVSQRLRLYVGEWTPEDLTGDARNYEINPVKSKEWRCVTKLKILEFDASCNFQYTDIPEGRYTLAVESQFFHKGTPVPISTEVAYSEGDLPVSVVGNAERLVVVFDVPEDLD